MNFDNLELKLQKFSFNGKKRVEVYENLCGLLKDGLPLDACLRQIHERMVARNNPMKHVFAIWMNSLISGKSFSDALAGWAPAQELVLISAGERGQDLPGGLECAIRVNKDSQLMKDTLSKAVIGPTFLIVALFFMVYGFSATIVPVLAKLLPPEKWQGSSRGLYHLSVFITNYWIITVVAIVSIIMVVTKTLDRWTGETRKKFDKLPPWSIYKVYSSATFIMAVSSLMQSGVPIDSALKYVKKTASPWVKYHINIMQRRLNSGMSYGNAMDTGLLTDEMIDQILIYENITDFNKAMNSIGDKAIRSSVKKMDVTSAVLKQVMTLIVGITLGWMYLASYNVNVQVATEASKMGSNK